MHHIFFVDRCESVPRFFSAHVSNLVWVWILGLEVEFSLKYSGNVWVEVGPFISNVLDRSIECSLNVLERSHKRKRMSG